jgi:protein AbiQ
MLRICNVKTEYVDFLRRFDDRVSVSDKKDGSRLRAYVGVVLDIGRFKYFAPLSSPKSKFSRMKNTLDFMKIENPELLGVIDINNMMPVCGKLLTALEHRIDKSKDDKKTIEYKTLLRKELAWLNVPENMVKIQANAETVYKIRTGAITQPYPKHFIENLKKRCCDFALLEEKCVEYCES